MMENQRSLDLSIAYRKEVLIKVKKSFIYNSLGKFLVTIAEDDIEYAIIYYNSEDKAFKAEKVYWPARELFMDYSEYIKLISEGYLEDYNFKECINISRNKDKRYVSKQIRYEVLNRQKWNCNICGCKLKYSSSNDWEGEVAHIDHIHPYSKRESYKNGIENINESSNLQALCPACNLSKTKKEIN